MAKTYIWLCRHIDFAAVLMRVQKSGGTDGSFDVNVERGTNGDDFGNRGSGVYVRYGRDVKADGFGRNAADKRSRENV